MAERIKINKKRPWGAIPESLVEDTRLGASACRLGVWLTMRPANWVVRPQQVMNVLGMGKDAYYSARAQLIQFGYLQMDQATNRGGQFGDVVYQFDPEPARSEPEPTVSGFSGYGSTGFGQTVSGKPGDLTTTDKQEHLKQQQPQRAERDQHQPPTPEAQAVVVVSDTDQAALVWPTGLDEGMLESMRRFLLGAWPGLIDAQALLDELAGRLQAQQVKNPIGYLRKLLGSFQAGEFVAEAGLAIRQQREGSRAHAKRLQAALAGSEAQLQVRVEAVEQGKSVIAEKELARIRALPGIPPAKPAGVSRPGATITT